MTASAVTKIAIMTLTITLSYSKANPGNTEGGSITVPLTSCLTGLESAV